jgi:hypothetical protein
MQLFNALLKRHRGLRRLTIKNGLLHLNSLWKQITAASWHCRLDMATKRNITESPKEVSNTYFMIIIMIILLRLISLLSEWLLLVFIQ